MAHCDLYDALGLDRSQDSVNLAQQIDQKINSGVATNPGGPEELRIARDILGNDQRRRMYDSKLNDPTAPDINIAALRDLAKLKVAENNSSATDAAPTVTSPTNNSQFAGPNPPQQNQGDLLRQTKHLKASARVGAARRISFHRLCPRHATNFRAPLGASTVDSSLSSR
ncbi:hypothetical protein [Corynebacterium sp.]|uniref:hypothetical protein n=1 Tax=Corynebacterium sp. TaxID=1720 RepID=UPI003736BF15